MTGMVDIMITVAVVALVIGAARLLINAANHIHVTEMERSLRRERARRFARGIGDR